MALNIHRDDDILGKPPDPSTAPGDDSNTRTQGMIDSRTILLFVKRTPVQPMCGYSATVTGIFNPTGVLHTPVNT